jgi:hypothetical protein
MLSAPFPIVGLPTFARRSFGASIEFEVALNCRNHSGDVSGAMRAKLENLASALRACCGKPPSTEPHHGAALDRNDFCTKTLVRV